MAIAGWCRVPCTIMPSELLVDISTPKKRSYLLIYLLTANFPRYSNIWICLPRWSMQWESCPLKLA